MFGARAWPAHCERRFNSPNGDSSPGEHRLVQRGDLGLAETDVVVELQRLPRLARVGVGVRVGGRVEAPTLISWHMMWSGCG